MGASAASLPTLRAQGTRVVDVNGTNVVLRGCNLGAWLVTESWMLGWDIADQEALIARLTERFGAAEADRLLAIYREGFVTDRDFENIKSFGFNVVRLPFDSRMLMDEQGRMKPDAFRWIDHALDLAEKHGVYVILDMHGAPGSQSIQDHTGRSGQNRFWSDPVYPQRMAELWTRLAERYKARSVVAAYDLMNEPYGDFRADLRMPLRALLPRVCQAIRSTGDRHIVIFPNGLGTGIDFYDDPKSLGMEQVGFTDHYYPGLFGSPSTLRSHAGMFHRAMPDAQAFLDRVGSPMLIGEFNVVLDKTGGKAMMRRYFDEFERRGWMATMWSYKLLKATGGVEHDNWYMATNAQPMAKINFNAASMSEIENYFREMATIPIAIDESLREALTSRTPPTVLLPTLDVLPATAPSSRNVEAWRLVDCATDIASGLDAQGARISITAAGQDIIGTSDSFGFLSQPVRQSGVLIARVDQLLQSSTWAKAGLMIRFGEPGDADYAAAPFAMVNTFSDGGLAFVVRDKGGAATTETKRSVGPLPRRLAILHDGPRIEAYADNGADGWIKLGSTTIVSISPAQIGLAVCSNRKRALTRADFSDVELRSDTHLEGVTSIQSPDVQPTDGPWDELEISKWNRWSDGFESNNPLETRQARWVGKAADGESGLWSDIPVEPGARYAFLVRVQRSEGADDSQRLVLAIESTLDGKQLALEERTIDVRHLAASPGWSVVKIETDAPSKTIRLLIRAGGDKGAVTIGRAILTRAADPPRPAK